MDYKKEMRQLIDIVKQQSFDAPLEQTLDDMKTLTTAVKDLNDRIEMRVRKNVSQTDKQKIKIASKTQPRTKTVSKKSSASPLPTHQTKSIPTSNPISTKSISSNDYNKVKSDMTSKQKGVEPITPQPPM